MPCSNNNNSFEKIAFEETGKPNNNDEIQNIN